MVQGLPAVKWTPENNDKLFQAVVVMYGGGFDNKKLASVFGPNVPAAAISYRMSVLRKAGAALGLSGADSVPIRSSAVSIVKRAAPAAGGKAKANGRKRGGIFSEDASDDEMMTSTGDNSENEAVKAPTNGHTTPDPSVQRQKTIGGRVTKPRVSPRKAVKPDYKTLQDPFTAVDATDADGEKVFDPETSDSEDTYAIDGEFGAEEKDAEKKTEEVFEAV